MTYRIVTPLLLGAAVVFLGACAEAPKPEVKVEEKKEAVKPPEPVAAKTAYFEMYKPARQWSADAQPLTLASEEFADHPANEGKAWKWTTVFVSPGKKTARTYFYNVVEHDKELRGVTEGGPQSWGGPTPKNQPFASGDFQTNSDDAYKTAMAKAADWVKAHPDKKLAMYLAHTNSPDVPAWYLMWGDSKSGYLAHVNAVTGALMK